MKSKKGLSIKDHVGTNMEALFFKLESERKAKQISDYEAFFLRAEAAFEAYEQRGNRVKSIEVWKAKGRANQQPVETAARNKRARSERVFEELAR
ncbi:MAG TPA: hypothetical protein GX687_01940 [Clostridia bacterium]|nr:hypothetical protein [Clostridia bacterium]